MTARRLLTVMLVLLVASTLAAALVPPASPPEPKETTEAHTRTVPPAPRGDLLRRTIDADAPRPRTISMQVGDQLALRVTSRRPAEVEIRGLDQIASADRFAPALFDLLPFRPGTYPVVLLGRSRPAGRIEVRPFSPSPGEPKNRPQRRRRSA